MLSFEPGTFGALNAEDYDETQDPGTTDESVALIADVAGNGRVLELASGTGRMTIPLAQLGFDISGIEGSEAMVAKMRGKPGGGGIPVVVGDMADVAIDGPFGLVFLVFNTLFNLTGQEAQIRLFANVADRLAPGGTFLIEAFVPDFSGYRDHEKVGIRKLEMDRLWLTAVRHDPVAQRLEHQRLRVSADGRVQLVPLVLRYAYPAELDLMARLAGLRLRDRWGGWDKRDFDAGSRMHVSVWEKA